MFSDSRSDWERLKSAQRLRRFVTNTSILGLSLYWISSRYQPRNSVASAVDRINFKLDQVVNWTDDVKDTIWRVGRYFWTGQVRDNDPIITQMLKGNPFRRIDRSRLPLLPNFEHLNFPRKMPTLLIDLDSVVAQVSYDRCFGWRVLKRPYADKLFKEMMFTYEIVIWSKQPFPVAQNLVTQWGLPVMGVLHKEHCTRLNKTTYIKDLSKLGRDLSRVVIVDSDPTAFMTHPENGITIRAFDPKNYEDKELEALSLYLKGSKFARVHVNLRVVDLASHKGDFREILRSKGRNSEVMYRNLISQQVTKSIVWTISPLPHASILFPLVILNNDSFEQGTWFRSVAQTVLGK
eukprot:Gregarina_sp_Poly_1__3561@NODE_2040_length_2795_cov_46_990469_g1316_i0_p1_GENE_NODE_2040_length_2795_cov_46_990469_g1316_i0NODE_2040_length_2795_cov_46_990469_g1316_i0_p1_ORF_typecomplete_len349_score22_90NIF/PF03031_18/5_3e26_NODE_2040_length_2795_cov_46_990469_g1316_i09552001